MKVGGCVLVVYAIICVAFAFDSVEGKQLFVGVPQYSSFVEDQKQIQYHFVPNRQTAYNVRLTRYDAFLHVNSTQILRVVHDNVVEDGTHDIHFTAKEENAVKIILSSQGESFGYHIRICEGDCQSSCDDECSGHGGCKIIGNKCECDVGFSGSKCEVYDGETVSVSSHSSAVPLAAVIVPVALLVVVVVVVIFGGSYNDNDDYVIEYLPGYHDEITDCAHCCPICACCTCCTVTITRRNFRRVPKSTAAGANPSRLESSAGSDQSTPGCNYVPYSGDSSTPLKSSNTQDVPSYSATMADSSDLSSLYPGA